MQRVFRLVLFAFFALLPIVLFSARSSHAQTVTPTPIPPKVTVGATKTIVVTNLNSSGDGSLFQAIRDATSGDTITFNPSLSGKIEADMSKYPLPNDPILDKDLTFEGPTSRSITLRMFEMYTPQSGLHITFRNLVFSGSMSGMGVKGSTLVDNCVFEDNAGIGIDNSAMLTVRNSVFGPGESNVVAGDGANILIANSLFKGGNTAVASNNSSITIVNSTFIGYNITIRGKGIELINSTIQTDGLAFFSADPKQAFTVRNTIIALSAQATAFKEITLCLASQSELLIDGGGNLQYPDTTCSKTIPVGDPRLNPLQDNGGATWTMALLPGSAAIGIATNCPPADQRGFLLSNSQSSASVCDSGAFQTKATVPQH